MIVFQSTKVDLVCVLIIVVMYYVYYYFNKTSNHWKSKKVPHVPPKLFFGNIKDALLFKTTLEENLQWLYNQFPEERFVGVFQSRKPFLLIRDPELIKQVLVKDFHRFQDRGIAQDFSRDPLAEHLLNMEGRKWSDLRHKLTPTFTSGKLKAMFYLISECAGEFQQSLKKYADNNEAIELRELNAKYTTEVIGSCAFGIQMKSLKDPDCKFREMGRKIFEANGKVIIRRHFRSFLPAVFNMLRMKSTPQDVEDFFLGVVEDIVRHRENTDEERHDFMQLLMQLKKKGLVDESDEEREHGSFVLNDRLLAAQAFIFFAAGFETSSATMSFCLYELAVNSDVQERVRDEIDRILEKTNGKLTYEGVMEMKYLRMVVAETLRKHPPAGILIRKCVSPYTIPGSDVTLNDNEQVLIPVFALHKDPKYYPNPDKFDPDRFSEETIRCRQQCTYLPFGEGPRNCIGIRFAKLQTMAGLASVISNYCISPCAKTEIPLRYEPKCFVLGTSGMWFQIKHRL